MRIKKRIFAIIMAVLMALAVAPTLPLTAQPVYAEEAVKDASNTKIGTEGMFMPSDYWSKWSYIYYGKYDGTPVKYRLLDKNSTDFGGKTMLLDCDNTLFKMDFTNDGTPLGGTNQWKNSGVRKALNGDSFLSKDGVFTSAERNAIHSSTKADASANDAPHWNNADFAPLNKDKIFLLDVREAARESYGYPPVIDETIPHSKHQRKKCDLDGSPRTWWTRSPCYAGGNQAVAVFLSGIIVDGTTFAGTGTMTMEGEYMVEVSPALNVKLSSVVLSTLVSGERGKKEAEYKLTLTDPNMSVSVTGDADRDSNDDKIVTVPYSISEGTDYTRVSVIMTDGTWSNSSGWSNGASTKYYGQIDSNTRTFTLPEDYSTDWNTYIIAEQTNGGTDTDYASTPVRVSIPDNPEIVVSGDQFITGKHVGLSAKSFVYNGEVQKPEILTIGGSADPLPYCTIEWSDSESTNAGTYTVTITSKDIIYYGTTQASYSIEPAEVSVPAGRKLVYNGKRQTGVAAGTQYTVNGNTATNAGTYEATVVLKDMNNYVWSDETVEEKAVTWKINKATNPLTAKGKTATVMFKKLKKKNQTLAVGKVLQLSKKGKGTVSYKLTGVTKSKFRKHFKINAKTGQVMVKKGLKKGKYKLKIKVTAAGNTNFKAGAKTVTATVIVK